MKKISDIRELQWVVHENVRAASRMISFKTRLFMESGLVLSIVGLEGAGDIEKPFCERGDNAIKKIRFEGLLSFGWDSKLGCIGGEHLATQFIDKSAFRSWLVQYPDDVAKICCDLVLSSDPVRFSGDKDLLALPQALNVLNKLPLEKLCRHNKKSVMPLSFFSLFREVSDYTDDSSRLDNIGKKLHAFFAPENRTERVKQSILARQFFMESLADVHVPYLLEKFLINYAGRNDDVVLMRALRKNVGGPWDSWVNEKKFLETMFDFGSHKSLAFFLHKGDMLESLLQEESSKLGDNKLFARMWSSINDERMRLALPNTLPMTTRVKV